jgi:SAM-dependent methyltransferase
MTSNLRTGVVRPHLHGAMAARHEPRLDAYGRAVGVDLLRAGRFRRGLRCLFQPVSYWRSIEYQLVWNAADFQRADRVLDVGSPKLLSLYLAEQVGAEVFATDIETYFVDEHQLLRRARRIPADRLHIDVQDGRRLDYPDNSFTKVYSISVIEHIPQAGDTECIREIGRVLAPGGQCFITVPFWRTSRERYRKPDFYWAASSVATTPGRVFYERHYSEEDLHARLINPSGLTLRHLEYVGERVLSRSEAELSDVPPVLGPLEPLLSRVMHVRASDWRALRKPLCAFLVLSKDGSRAN